MRAREGTRDTCASVALRSEGRQCSEVGKGIVVKVDWIVSLCCLLQDETTEPFLGRINLGREIAIRGLLQRLAARPFAHVAHVRVGCKDDDDDE